MMTELEREIGEQPEVIARLIDTERDKIRQIADSIRKFDPAYVLIAARGTSDNAARYAQYAFGIQTGLLVALATPSVHTLYEAPPRMGRALVIGVSQSGQSTDVRQVLTDARSQGALTLSITNDPASPLAEGSDWHIPLHAGKEKSVAATKTYTAELTAFALLAAALADRAEMWSQVEQLPGWAKATLDAGASTSEWGQRYRYMERFAVIGRGYNYCTSFEISLKVKELCYIFAEGYSEADFRHGPIATILPGVPVLVVAPMGKTFEQQRDLLVKLNERGAECLAVTNDPSLEALTHHVLPIPADVPEWLSPIVSVMPGQLFALNLAMMKGLPVDQPRGLTKVTDTV
ncbi:MAG: SIS domain-containing protein [Chloroflexi bacterium]|nr:SIS domain-containing protein [Chloroflexota bacterium]